MSIIKDTILEDHSTDGKRSGEGAVVGLNDGTLYFVYGQFDGPFDASAARLVSRRSPDGGMSWEDAEVFFEPDPAWVNVMSVSLLRLQDGGIGCAFLAKLAEDTCVPHWTSSSDDAQSWSEPQPMVSAVPIFNKPHFGYYVVNNDRLVQLANGRILVPYAHYVKFPERNAVLRKSRCGCLISDDGGANWRHSQDEIQVQPENYHVPECIVADATPALRVLRYELVTNQEPGVIELTDGRVLMWARSNGGCAYAAYSTDAGETWGPFKALCGIPMAQGPATIKRVPGTQRLVMIHNDRTGVPYGSPAFPERTPLAVSVSDDEGSTWQRHQPLRGDNSDYCYYSILFFGDKSLVTTYESANIRQEDGSKKKTGRAKLRTIVLENAWWTK